MMPSREWDVLWYVELVGAAGLAVLAGLTRYQNGGGWIWLAPVVLAAALGAYYLKQLRHVMGASSPREERLWSELFGERWWQLLLADPRLRSWPRLCRVLRRFFGGIVFGEAFIMGHGVVESCASAPPSPPSYRS